MDELKIQKIKQILALGAGLGLMWVSAKFSVSGFGFQIPNMDGIGLLMAIAIIVIELVFNGQLAYKKSNITIYVIGLAAYAYGIFSNISGIWVAQALNFTSFDQITFGGWFGVALGLFLEIAPEPMIVFGLIGISDTEGDMINAVMSVLGRGKSPSIPSHMKPSVADRDDLDTFRGVESALMQSKSNKYTPQHKPKYN